MPIDWIVDQERWLAVYESVERGEGLAAVDAKALLEALHESALSELDLRAENDRLHKARDAAAACADLEEANGGDVVMSKEPKAEALARAYTLLSSGFGHLAQAAEALDRADEGELREIILGIEAASFVLLDRVSKARLAAR